MHSRATGRRRAGIAAAIRARRPFITDQAGRRRSPSLPLQAFAIFCVSA